MKRLSSEANIGKLILLLGVILSSISIIFFFIIGIFFLKFVHPSLFSIFIFFAVLSRIFGIVFGLFAYNSCLKGDFYKAGILGIVASLLSFVDLIFLVGAILCLLSKEAKKNRY